MAGVERDAHELELDRIAWNLPEPIPRELSQPPDDEWPPSPFEHHPSEDVEVELHQLPDQAT